MLQTMRSSVSRACSTWVRNPRAMVVCKTLPAIHARGFATPGSAPQVIVEKDEAKKIAVLKMNRPPANSLNTDFMLELTLELQKLQDEGEVRGLILSSTSKNIFCAGLDLLALAGASPESLQTFWTAHQDLWLTLYGSPLATVAAIQGAAPAAGCMLAMACDHRIMAPKFAIGLNEAKFGLIAPTWMQQNMVNIVGHRQADRLMSRGLLLEAEEAKRVGLVDEVVPAEEVMAAAEREVLEMISVSDKARAMTKAALRFDSLAQLRRMRDEDQAWFLHFVLQDDVQASLNAYIDAIKKRSAKK